MSTPRADQGGAAVDPVALPASGVSVWNFANLLTFIRLLLVPVFAVR